MLSKYVNDNIMTTNANRFTGDYTKEKKNYGLYTGLFCISIRLTLGSETKHVLFPQFNYHYTYVNGMNIWKTFGFYQLTLP